MPDPLVLGVFLAIVALVAGLLVTALVRRSRRDAGIPLAPAPADPGPLLVEARGLYLATTLAGSPYERAPIRGLFFRASAHVRVHRAGIAVDAGRPFWIPSADVTGAGRTNLVIDRVVEDDGLTVLGWRAGQLAVESTFRLDPADRDAVIDAALSIRPGAPVRTPQTPSTTEETR